MKYRKKPIVIEAHRIGDNVWPDSIWRGVTGNEIILNLNDDGGVITGCVHIKTLEGTMIGNIGDYIICGVQGEFYPCKADIFEATYEPAE